MAARRRLPLSLVLAVLCVAATDTRAEGKRIEGVATVVDGDTLEFEAAGERVRLYAIDAPESGQSCEDAQGKRYLCGVKAAEYLARLVGRSGRVTCHWDERDDYGRAVAECATPDNRVLNAEMVKAGWAVVFRRFSDGRYDGEEADARSARRGLWAGRFVQPADWRLSERAASQRLAVERSRDCRIKGNISGSNRIYHSPGQENYDHTQIDVAAGERWFCSAEEAEAAGWRPARR